MIGVGRCFPVIIGAHGRIVVVGSEQSNSPASMGGREGRCFNGMGYENITYRAKQRSGFAVCTWVR